MQLNYESAHNLFRDDKIRELASSAEGIKFLKLRSLSRREQMERLAQKVGLDIGGSSSREWLRLLYEFNIDSEVIEETIKELYKIGRVERQEGENELINELYKVKSFEWGGLHQNSLEKTIVDNYVKRIKSYEQLGLAIENELHNSMRSYVLASWYNHWTSIIIEDIFKDHDAVLPAVGLVKKIDFFVGNKPFDLKVTYLPEGYIKSVRREEGLRPELTLLKQQARNTKTPFDRQAPETFLLSDLWRKLEDSPDLNARALVDELKNYRINTLDVCIADPTRLICWLYENQGVRRFDASNRLFLVLVDKDNFFESWKLKRAKSLIAQGVNDHLSLNSNDPGFKLKFKWENLTYEAESDIVFVVKE